MTFWPVVGFLFICYCEYLLDFKFQRREVATQKSHKFEFLSEHIMILIGGLFFPCLIVFGIKYGAGIGFIMAMFFTVMNGMVHGVIDWNIWKSYHKKVEKRIRNKLGEQEDYILLNAISEFKTNREYAEDPAFYNTIGFDRYLHFGTLFVLYCWFM